MKIASSNAPKTFVRRRTSRGMEEYERLYRKPQTDPEKFWGEIASELHWFKPWDKVLDWNCPWAKWFSGGELNLSYNCLDRHVASAAAQQGRADLGRRARRSADAHLSAIADRSFANSPTS